jgi:hypothetical protein
VADGIDYNFITRACFDEMIAADAFQWVYVFGNLLERVPGTRAGPAPGGTRAGHGVQAR